MIGALIAVVLASGMTLHPTNLWEDEPNIELVSYDGERVAVHVTSVDWNEPGVVNPEARSNFGHRMHRAHVTRQVCVRSDHAAAGELTIESNRFAPVIVPHDDALRTRCALVTTYGWASKQPLKIRVSEGTYWGAGGTTPGPVDGWVLRVSLRKVPTL